VQLVSGAYSGREQTEAKHFILKRYLQALAFKVLHGWDITYIDGFSGPWESRTEDFSDTSFMIAIAVLKDAQKRILAETGRLRRIRCFFSENDQQIYGQLKKAVAPHHNPSQAFEIETHCGKFEDAVPQIKSAIGRFIFRTRSWCPRNDYRRHRGGTKNSGISRFAEIPLEKSVAEVLRRCD